MYKLPLICYYQRNFNIIVMEIFQISDPNEDVRKGSSPKKAVGIDFGTTNSLIAFSSDRKPYVIGNELIPSSIDEDQSIGSGKLKSIKSLIGKSYKQIINSPEISEYIKSIISEIDGKLYLKIGHNNHSINEAIALIFKHLKIIAESSLKENIDAAVISVPAHFDDKMRSAIKESAEMSGLEVLRLIAEPTAAAYAYGLENKAEGIYAVYDLGGGTFDISILRMKMGVFQVLATAGDNNIGGDNIDFEIAKIFAQQNPNLDQEQLLKESKSAKEFLSEQDLWENKELSLKLSLKEFDKIAFEIINSTMKISQTVIDQVKEDLTGIILVGGSTRIRLIHTMLKKFGTKIFDKVDPDKVVALGAALQSENLTCGSKDLLIDVVPLSLGMEMMGNLVEKIILKNSPLPTSVTKEFTTYADNQTEIQVNIFQGEREMTYDCRELARFSLSNIPPMKAGMARISVTFNLDADGILNVSATEKITGIHQEIEVRPTYGINQDKVDHMIEEAYKHAKEDIQSRLLAEKKIEAEREILTSEASMRETPEVLDKDEEQKIKESIHQIHMVVKNDDRDKIDNAIKKLKSASEKFNEKRMDFILQKALKGKKV